MKSSRLTLISLNAKTVARRYRRRVWWVSVEDLEQEALAAQLAAERTFDLSKGEFGGYAWRAAVLACHRYVLSQSAPVSGRHDPSVLKGLYREEFASESNDADQRKRYAVVPGQGNEDLSLEEAIDRARLAVRVRRRLRQVLGKQGEKFALGMLTREFTPREVARDHSVEVQRVYSAVRSIRDKVSADQVLYDLWREL